MSAGLAPLLRPRSVAIIGASRDPTKRGHQAARALQASAFQGEIQLVHPQGGELLGLPVSPCVAELPSVPDLAVICTSAAQVPDIVRACSQRGIPGAIVLAVGFREVGQQGRVLEEEILSLAEESGLRLIGPNTSGVMNPAIGLNLVGAPPVGPGSLALLSQSGNVGLDVMTQLGVRGLGMSLYVGVGNEGDVRFDEYLSFLEAEDDTRGILIYAEGFSDPRAFLRVAGRVNRTKPIVLLKGGRSEDGKTAALSHTGAIAGSYDVLEALLRQRGVTVTRRSDELLALGLALAGQPALSPGAGIAVIADGGGHASLAADLLTELGVALAEISPAGQERLRDLLGPPASVSNPVDLSVFCASLEHALSEPGVGGVLLTGLFGGYSVRFDDSLADAEDAAAACVLELVGAAGVPLVLHTLYAACSTPALRRLREAGVPVLGSLDTACRCTQALQARGRFLAAQPQEEVSRSSAAADGAASRIEPGDSAASRIIEAVRLEGRAALTEAEARVIVAEAGVPMVRAEICVTAAEAVAAAKRLKAAAVAKLISSTILHRSEAGGVELGLETLAQVEQAFARIRDSAHAFAKTHGIEADFRGVLVSELLSAPVAELLVGCRRDPRYGPVLVVGAGGVSAEVWPDRSLRGLPVTEDEILDMLRQLRIFSLLRGYRGRPAADLASLVRLIQCLSECFLAHQDLAELELNPVFAGPTSAVAVDVLASVVDI